MYFKSINNFAKSDFSDENLIGDTLEFDVTSSDEADLNTSVLYNNLANPITISYVNQNIKTDYTITDTSTPITYDGSLLKKCNVSLDEIKARISFDVNITNQLDQEFKSTVSFDIPLENEGKTLDNDGNISFTEDCNFTFYRYK